MNCFIPRSFLSSTLARFISIILAIAVFTLPLRAQQPTAAPRTAPVATSEKREEPTFDTLLSADTYKMYGEVRNVGALLTTGGAGEIVEPIIKLADPGPEFKSIVSFLKKNSEALATSRLMFATWPARTDIPTTFIAIEFATPEEAAKFAPTLEKFLPTVMPPIPVNDEAKKKDEELTRAILDVPNQQPTSDGGGSQPAKNESRAQLTVPAIIPEPKPKASSSPPSAVSQPTPEPQPRFVLSRAGNLVFISDKAFKVEKLRTKSGGLLAEDHNFRVARDRFSSEPVFLFFNVALEDKTKPKPSPTPVMTEEEEKRIQEEAEALAQKEIEEERIAREKAGQSPEPDDSVATTRVELVTITPSPTPTPSKEQEAQRVASNQIGSMLGMLGQGEPQWPDAIGLALALDNDEYVARAILINSESSKRLTLPFIPQLISGPAYAVDAPSVLPDDTEVFVSASIDFAQTYREMKMQAEATLKRNPRIHESISAETSVDSFAAFEKRAGFKISDELLPVLGNEMAVAISLKSMNQFGIFGVPAPKTSSDDPKAEKQRESFPIVLIAIKDREAARRLMPRVMNGMGLGAANLLAQKERRGEAEIVNYAGVFAYGFIGNFLVISDANSVRRVADANTNRQTLSSNNLFRGARHWQPKATLGEVYVSPALMEGYQQQVGKMSSTMDSAMRDFLMQLSPNATAITYALSNDGLGTIHELHLPKNLILAMIAGTSAAMSSMKEGSPEMNEMIAMSALGMIAGAEQTYKAGPGKGTYGSIDMLANEKLVQKDVFEKYGYRFDLFVSGDHFEATATPAEYGKTGKRSFFVDQTGVVRGDDHGGGPASSADKPAQ
jgi:hypothetical protein